MPLSIVTARRGGKYNQRRGRGHYCVMNVNCKDDALNSSESFLFDLSLLLASFVHRTLVLEEDTVGITAI